MVYVQDPLSPMDLDSGLFIKDAFIDKNQKNPILPGIMDKEL